MNLRVCHFSGYWPVGAVALVFAHSDEEATALMRAKLEEMKLTRENEFINIETLPCEIIGAAPGVRVLLDGNY